MNDDSLLPGAAVPVVELRGVRKVFNPGEPNETEVLHGIDLRLGRGEFCAVMGPSGSGKSTLLNIVGLLDRPSAGSLWVGGRDTTTLDDAALTHLRGHTIGHAIAHTRARAAPRPLGRAWCCTTGGPWSARSVRATSAWPSEPTGR